MNVDPPTDIPSCEEIARFARENGDYYGRVLRDLALTGSTVSWNWGAFLGGVLWLGYRRMYVSMILIQITAFLAAQVAEKIPVFSDVLGYGGLLTGLLTGAYGNALYLRFGKRHNFATEKQGTDIIGAVILQVVFLLLAVLIFSFNPFFDLK